MIMPIDMNKAKQRMTQLQNQRKDYSKISYGLKQGDNVLRFVTPPGEDWPFIYGSMYRNMKMKRQYFMSPSMHDEPDPILQQLQVLRKNGTPEDIEFAKKLFPSRRVFALAIIRGQEDKGIVWVDFPQKIEKQLVEFILNEQYGDITDLKNGTDFTISKRKGNPYPEYSVMPKRNASKLLPTDAQITQAMANIPQFKDAFKHYTYEQLQEIWDKFINGDSDDDSTTSSDEVQDVPDEDEKIDVTAALLKFKNKQAAN